LNGEVLILGAGPAGVGAAWALKESGLDLVLIEKESTVGGLSRTLQYGEFRTDIGPHRFYSQNRDLYRVISDLLGPGWLMVQRITHFYIDGRLFLYPVQLRDALTTLGPKKGLQIFWDYAIERVKDLGTKESPATVEDELVSRFGRSLAELNMLNYTEKVWGFHPSRLSPDWTSQRIKDLKFTSVLAEILKLNREGPKTLVNAFHYPEHGAGCLYRSMTDAVASKCRLDLLTSSRPSEVRHDGKRIVEVVVETSDGSRSFHPREVISSIPITEMVELLEPGPPPDVIGASEKLKFRSHVGLFIQLDRASTMRDQWIYFPEREIPFGRVSEPKNFSKAMSPENSTSLMVEFFCWEEDPIWNSGPRELFDLSREALAEAGLVEESEVIDISVHREKYAYPVYELGYDEHLLIVKEYLQNLVLFCFWLFFCLASECVGCVVFRRVVDVFPRRLIQVPVGVPDQEQG
jgi:protoporphyrinogen oxidase